MSDSISYEQLLLAFTKVPVNYWNAQYKKLGSKYKDSFKVSVKFSIEGKVNYGVGFETWWIENSLYDELIKKEKER